MSFTLHRTILTSCQNPKQSKYFLDKQLIIRAGHGTLSFTVKDGGNTTVYPYAVKSDRSLPANLREAFKELQFLRALERDGVGKILADTVLMVASPVMLVPDDVDIDITPASVDATYGEIITGYKGEEKFVSDIPELRVKAVFAVDSDLLLVANDNCSHVTVNNVLAPVWVDAYSAEYQNDGRHRLFAYFHDRKVSVFSFEQHRIHFANTFDAAHAHDALYYIMFVWKQLGFSQENDVLYLYGSMPHADWLMVRLKNYVRRIERDENYHRNI